MVTHPNIFFTGAYGMGGYGGADARSMYGAGYGGGQAVSAQAYGVPGASAPSSQYSGYGMC